MERYVEIALGSPQQRGRAVRLSEIPAIQKHAQANRLELYRSYYYFDQTLQDHLQAFKTVKGFRGTPFVEILTLDVDKGADTDDYVHQRAIAVLLKLKELPIEDINIRPYYSGSGYHFVLPNLWNFKTDREVKETLTELFPECDTIYDRARLIRVANTINFKTQRYKIPLEQSELLHRNTAYIIELSGQPRNDFRFPDFELNTDLEKGKKEPKHVMEQQPAMVKEEGLSPVITCMQRLYNSLPQKGSRHQSILRMVSAFKRSGVPREGIETMMVEWTQTTMEVGEVRKIVADVFAKNYAYSCQDDIMSKFCDSRCMFYTKKSYNSSTPRNVLDIEEDLKKQAINQDQKYIELSTFFQLHESFGIYPEEYVVIEGDTGLGKSALSQNILVQNPTFKTLYLNFEVGERLMYRRFLQIAHGMTKHDIIQHYTDPKAPTLSDAVSHIHMVSDRISIPTLENLLVQHQYEVVVVDTLECFITPGINEITPKTEFVAHELKRLAKKYRNIIIAIHHISKSSVQDSQGRARDLTVHAGKGSSAVEQEADKLILLEGKENSPIRRIRSAKARDESPFTIHMNFDAERTFRYYKEPLWSKDNGGNGFADSSTPSDISPSTSTIPEQEPPRLLGAELQYLP
jgi:archaellum biogenesis ATPase FlaH